MLKHLLVLCLLLTVPARTYPFSTGGVSGRVVDAATGKPLAFVNVIANNGRQGTTSDIDGKFTITSTQPILSLTFSYVGYETFTTADQGQWDNHLLIQLARTDYLLKELVIRPGENPAHRIINEAVRNKPNNDPVHIESFVYNSYNKVVYTTIPKSERDEETDQRQKDLEKFLETHHLILMESYTERKYQASGKTRETVLATRVSGLNNPSFTVLATDFQPFSFYDNRIELLDRHYVSPLSPGCTSRYLFILEDTTYSDADTTFIISFRPSKGRNFESLSGLLYINTNGYAIENVIAESVAKELNSIKVQQQYVHVNGHWFPSQLNFDWVINEYDLLVYGRSYISNVRFDTVFQKGTFGHMAMEVAADASQKTDSFWVACRTNVLSQKDSNTYHYIDSVGQARKLDSKMEMIESIVFGTLPIGFLDIDLARVYDFNYFEGHRLGMGLSTNHKLSKWFSLSGYCGYGLLDERLKYGGTVKLSLSKSIPITSTFGYRSDVHEPGNTVFYESKLPNSTTGYRKWLAGKMNTLEEYRVGIQFRALKFAEAELSAVQSTTSILDSSYRFVLNGQDISSQNNNRFGFSTISFRLRYAHKEHFAQMMNRQVSLGTDYPVVWLNIRKGITFDSHGQFDFWKFAGRLYYSIPVNLVGQLDMMIEGGIVDGNVPYTELVYGAGSYNGRFTLLVDYSFQTMRLYEFLSDKYAHLFLNCHLGKILFKTDMIKPEFIISNNVGFGTMANTQSHTGLQYQTMEKGYYEAGLMIKNIVRARYRKLIYIGAGFAGFYRYGHYAFNDPLDNVAFKFSLLFSL